MVVGVVSKMVITFALSVQLKSPLDPDERSAYAAPDDEPIEDAAWDPQAPGVDPDDKTLPLKRSGRLSRRWRAD